MKVIEILETALKDKHDLAAKRKALQDMEREPGHDKAAVRQRKLDLEKEAKKKGYSESATAGATSSASIGTVVNPHISPGKARGNKSYIGSPWGGKSGTKAPPQPKVVQPKNSNGTAKNGLDIKSASVFGGPTIKR